MGVDAELGASWLIDGGVAANNPTMCAIAEARRVWNKVSLSKIRVVSVGTGFMMDPIDGPKSQKWGALQWVSKGKILEILAGERVVAYQCITLMDSGNYIRVNAKLLPQPGLNQAPSDAMDDVSRSNIQRLKELGEFWFAQYGEAVIQLIMNQYEGPSLDRIDSQTGKPITFD